MSGLALLDFLMFDLPVVVLVEESEDLSEVLRLLLEELVEDVEFSPSDLVIVVQIISLQQLLFDFLAVQVLQVIGVDDSVDVANALLDHLQD